VGDELIKIAVADDESIIREQIRKFIEKREKNCRIDSYETGEALLAAETSYDIVFLDIQMDGLNGIDTAKLLREQSKDVVIIFITAMKEYVFEAFDVAAFHYILKPIREERFVTVYTRAAEEVMYHKKQEKKPLFIKTRNRNITLEQKDILYIESRAKKVEIHTQNDVIEVYGAISKLEKELCNDFYRSHRGYLVNLGYVAEYSSDSITLNNGDTILMAKEKYGEFVKVYMHYMKKAGSIFVRRESK